MHVVGHRWKCIKISEPSYTGRYYVKRAARTCAECDEKQLDLLAFWEQLNEVELERNHVDVLLRDQMFSCTHDGKSSHFQTSKR